MELERGILKSIRRVGTTKQMTYQFIQQPAEEYPVRVMCRVLRVSPSGYYRWRQPPRSQRAAHNQQLLEKIERVHHQSRQTYGSPKIEQALRQPGIRCERNRIMRLMWQAGLASKRPRGFKRTTQANAQHRDASNHRQQRFVATAPNRVWLSDVTYVATQAGWLYVATVLDLFSRRIVGWAMDAQSTGAFTQRALQMALRQRQPLTHPLLHHSDRGRHYTSADDQQLLANHHITVRMSGTGNCYDSAPMENFFTQLKTEHVSHHRYPTRQAAMTSLFTYIEGFYSTNRLHGALGYRSPVHFEAVFSYKSFAYPPVP